MRGGPASGTAGGDAPGGGRRGADLAVALLLSAAVFLARLPFPSAGPTANDGAQHVLDARELLEEGRLKPLSFTWFKPLYLAGVAGTTAALRLLDAEAGVLSGAIALSMTAAAGAVGAAYLLGRALLLDRASAATASLLLAASPVFAVASVEPLSEGPALLLLLLALLATLRGGTPALAIGGLLFGASLLVRIQSALALPAFALAVANAARRRRALSGVAFLAAAALPAVLFGLGARLLWNPDKPLSLYLPRPEHGFVRLGQFFEPESLSRWGPVLAYAVGPFLLGAGVLGGVLVTGRMAKGGGADRALLLGGLAWGAPFLVVPASRPNLVARHLLFVVPAFAFAAAAGLRAIVARFRRERAASGVVLGGGLVLVAATAAPSLALVRSLRDRVPPSFAKARWFSGRRDSRETFLGFLSETAYVQAFADRARVFTAGALADPRVFFEDPSDPGPRVARRAIETASPVIEEHLRQGWTVFVSPPREQAALVLPALRERFDLVPVARLEGARLHPHFEEGLDLLVPRRFASAPSETIWALEPRRP